MIVILIGAPGVGKGTQAERFVQEFSACKIATGDALRGQLKLGSEVGLKAKEFINQGRLVPDELLYKILRSELAQVDSAKVVLDGFPRNVLQAQTFETLEAEFPITAVLHLDVANDVIVARLEGRRVCGDCGATYHLEYSPPEKSGVCNVCGGSDLVQRPDDHGDTIRKRLDVFDKHTKPVLDYYRKRALYHRIDGNKDPALVFDSIKKLVFSLQQHG